MAQNLSTTREVLTAYKNISKTQKLERERTPNEDIDTLSRWRREVPKDARKIWIRHFVSEVAKSKISADFELFHELLTNSLDQSLREEYESLLKAIQTQQDEEEDEFDAVLVLESFLEDNINDEILENFTRQYFLTFDDNQQRMREFLEKQKEAVSYIKAILDLILKEGGNIIKPIFEAMPITLHGKDSLHNFINNEAENLKDMDEYASSLIVYGSSAIAPRKNNYPRDQDIDIVFLPRITKAPDKKKLGFALSAVDYIGMLFEIMQSNDKDAKEELKNILPENLAVLLNYFEENISIDLHAVNLPEESGYLDGWRRLCGPHRIAARFCEDWEDDYRYFLNHAIYSARMVG